MVAAQRWNGQEKHRSPLTYRLLRTKTQKKSGRPEIDAEPVPNEYRLLLQALVMPTIM